MRPSNALALLCLVFAITSSFAASPKVTEEDKERIAQEGLDHYLKMGIKASICGSIGHIGWGVVVDGPSYYFEAGTGKVISKCSGFVRWCRGAATANDSCQSMCPPPEWEDCLSKRPIVDD